MAASSLPLTRLERAMTKPTDTLIQATAMIVAAQITARATRSASMPVMHARATLSHEFVDVYRALEHAIGQLSAQVAQAQTDADMTIKINP